MDDLRVLFFLYLVESYILTITGLRLFDYKSNARTLVTIAAIHGLGVWVVRGIYNSYNIPFGTHTLILTLLLFVLIKLIVKVDWGTAFGVTLVSICLLLIGSNVITGPIYTKFHLDLAYVLDNIWLHILLGYTEDTFLIIMLFINRITGFSIARSLGIKRVCREKSSCS